jgi:hypothetical protein
MYSRNSRPSDGKYGWVVNVRWDGMTEASYVIGDTESGSPGDS